MTEIIDALNWRYACKLFDTTKKVSKDDLDEIIEVFRLATSAF
jgi:nitroreductase